MNEWTNGRSLRLFFQSPFPLVDIVTRLPVMLSGGSNTCRCKRFLSSPKSPDRLSDPQSLTCNEYRGYFLGLKRPGREVDHTPPSSVEVKNELSCIPAHPVSLHGVEKENFMGMLTVRLDCI